MKIRLGFVSNSSSSSFVVALSVLTDEERKKIISYNQHYKSGKDWTDRWDIWEDPKKGILRGITNMDNGDLSDYLGNDLNDKLTYS